jgi:hypothetical protein
MIRDNTHIEEAATTGGGFGIPAQIKKVTSQIPATFIPAEGIGRNQ